ncbi:protein neuralized-like isoform X1 [Zophobas morio]|uniref:protein neuralized-like isoform X1 n=1 Tax=Zophobas morio TaxID=2755281 RepID=UPI003082FF26
MMTELRFHNIHGANIALSPDGHVAQRLQGYGKGLVFSARPVKVNEKVSIKLLKLSTQLSSTVCFGFTSKNPNTLLDDVDYSYLDVFKMGCYWIWPLFKNMCVEGTSLFYYVTRDGHVHFGVDGQEIDSFYKRVYTGGPLWAILDIDGVSTTVEVVPSEEVSGDEEDDEEGDVYEMGEEFINADQLCTVCCQKEINAVLYKCGHMCMCYQCAVKQRQGVGNGQCPICRAVIKDVIRTYK